ncbi:MAG TPA: CoA-transferase, partial [Spirochaetia bacterium]|nr:CoA-transferase [Spirochaetia bacterium]
MIEKPVINAAEAAKMVNEGDVVHVGGFLACGSPLGILAALAARGTKNLTLICNDTATPEIGVGKFVIHKQLKKAIVSHIGTNPETGRQMITGELSVEL